MGNPMGIREVWVWSVGMVSVAFWADIVHARSGDPLSLDSMIVGVLDNGAFDVLAWILVFARVSRMYEARPARGLLIGATFLAGAIVLAPVRLAPAVALVMLGGLLLRDRHARSAGREVGLIFLVLAFESLWRSPFMAPLHVLVGHVDASIDAFLLSLLKMEASAHANVVDNISANFSISIWPYCTSSLPLASVSLSFLVMVLYLGHSLRRRYVLWLCMSFVGSILLTEIRLLLLATNEANYDWWHDGPGVTVYAVAALALAVVFPILATRGDRTADAALGEQHVA